MRIVAAPVLVTLLIGLALAPARAQDAGADPLARRVLDGFLLPVYDGLDRAATNAASEMEALCASPSKSSADDAQAAFRNLVIAWSQAEIIRFGPIADQGRLDRFLFWPDRKGIGLRQVQALIADPEAAKIDVQAIARKSVGVQGMGALEYVLYGTDSEQLQTPAGATRCRIGSAIAANLAIMADDTLKAWRDTKGIAASFLSPGPDNATWRTGGEVAAEVFSAMVQGLQLVRDVRIGGFVGATPTDDKPKSAIYWRSGFTVVSITANLDGLHRLFDAADYYTQLKDDDRLLAQSVGAQFANASEALKGIDAPIADVLSDPKRREALVFVRTITTSLSQVIGTQVSGALGLSAGFSSLDGD